jgi:hypothetical protein
VRLRSSLSPRSLGPCSFALVALLVACGGRAKAPPVAQSAPAPVEPAEPAPRFEISDQDIALLVRDVSAARQLPPTHPVAVTRLARAPFLARLLERRGGAEPAGKLSEESAFLLGFDFVPDPSQRARVASLDEVLKEQVAGFYDRDADRVFIPDLPAASADDLREQRAVLAHEVQHALQAQRFPRLAAAQSSDEGLAHLALLEGDAMVAMGAFLGAEAGAPVGRTLRRIVEVTRRVPLATVTRGEQTRQLDRALPITRRRLEFPYEEGMLFVSDVYRAGGFPLVDRLYARPPRSSAQILHPEKYLAGALPRPIADPRPPPGYTVASIDTMGELDTRVLLERCMAPALAERAAAGWAGDRVGVFVGPARKLAVAWISAWDSEADAEELASALSKSEACWHENALGLAHDDYVIDAAFHAQRKGKLVAFVRGFPREAATALEEKLFPLVGPEPARTPLTDLTIPPRVILPEPTPGRLEGEVYRNDWLGLVGRVPPGMRARVGGHLDFFIERPDVLVHGGLSISTRITSDAENEKTFQEVQDALVAEVGKHSMRVERLGTGPADTPLGKGVERSWRIEGTSVELRLMLLPVCAGTGSIVLVELSGDSQARRVLDGWIGSFRWTHGRNLPACDYLDPK